MKKFESTVIKKEYLTKDVVELTLSAPSDFEFEAGQFVNIKLIHEGQEKRKSFSILNPPNEKGKISLCIKILDNPSSSSTFKDIKEGDKFEVMGPMGHFKFDKHSEIKEHYFLAAGTGVTPLYSILLEFVNKLPNHKFTLLFGVKTKDSQYLIEKLTKLEENNPNFTLIPVLSREKDAKYKGHVQDFLPENLENKDFYICGLKDLVLETEQLLTEKGVKKENIKKERYS